MPMFSKESLETLKQRIDLVDVLTSHVEFKRSGAAYKALCPFHDEKTPSFMIQKGDTHYHCYGCGAHGDAIQFLITHLKMSFSDAVESLAQRFHVHLEIVEQSESKGPNKSLLKDALEKACQFFQFYLLHTAAGQQVLPYLYKRGIDLDFIRLFGVGLAPAQPNMLRKILHTQFVKDETMLDAGLLSLNSQGGYRDFFSERITFPVRDASGAVIGFSARKYREETFGGKYINTTETALFKKSRILFGLNYSRKRIAKERRVIIVEGQIDALRLIHTGMNITVAGQGTAFGEGHVKELLALGVNQVFLAMDSDEAGQAATAKIGHLFQKEGVGVKVVKLPPGKDPDLYVREYGVEGFLRLLQEAEDYIAFLVKHHSKQLNLASPAGKNELVKELSKQIRSWEHPVLVHESLRQLALITHTPEEILGVGQQHVPNLYIKPRGSVGLVQINPDRILEADLLRCLLMVGNDWIEYTRKWIASDSLSDPVCQRMYNAYIHNYEQGEKSDLLSLVIQTQHEEGQQLLEEILNKKVNKDKVEQHLKEAIEKILARNLMNKREAIKQKIQSGQCSDEEVLELVKQFDQLLVIPVNN